MKLETRLGRYSVSVTLQEATSWYYLDDEMKARKQFLDHIERLAKIEASSRKPDEPPGD